MQFIPDCCVLKALSITFTTKKLVNNYFMRILTVLFLLLLIIPSCDREKQPVIPYVYVNLQLYPNSMDFIPVGGYKYIDAGYRGIVIYRMLPEQFMVYERCCPYDPEKTGARITVDASGSTCVDSVCMSKFILYDGTPYEGPSPYMLMQYKYSYDGETLLIYN
jgi:hypothetical protein